MNVTLSVDDELIQLARRKAEVMGTSVNQLVRDYLERFVGCVNPVADAAEFEYLSLEAQGESRECKFQQEEVHERQ